MPTVSNILSATLGLCGTVDTTAHPNLIGQTARVINQISRLMMQEARLSDQNQYLRFLTLNSPTKEVAIPSIIDPNSIVTCELLVDDVTDSRQDIDIVGRLELNANEDRGTYAVARFANPTRLRFTWNPSESADTLYIGYEVLPVSDVAMADTPRLPESFHDVLTYRSAAIIRETMLGLANTPVFLDTLAKFDSQWMRWCRRDSEERPIIKPGFGSLDYGDPMEMY